MVNRAYGVIRAQGLRGAELKGVRVLWLNGRFGGSGFRS